MNRLAYKRLNKIPSTLESSAVSQILGRLHAKAEREDPLAKQRVQAREAELGETLPQERRYELYGEAPLAITREVGRLLYMLTRTSRAQSVVEFGCSLGISTIYLAAAIRDAGNPGEIVTTELLPEKISSARKNLAEAGLEDLVKWREGDALETLRQLPASVDLFFLDGRNDLRPYLDYVRDPDNDYTSVEIPLADGVEVSVRSSSQTPASDAESEMLA